MRSAGFTRAAPFVLFLVSCSVTDSTQQAEIEKENSIVSVKSRCIDTLRTILGTTKSFPPRTVYRDEAFMFQIRAEVDLRTHDYFPDSLTIVALMPDESLSLHFLKWREAIDVSPTTATFSFLVKTTSKGMAHFKLVSPRENQLDKRHIRLTGVFVTLKE